MADVRYGWTLDSIDEVARDAEDSEKFEAEEKEKILRLCGELRKVVLEAQARVEGS